MRPSATIGLMLMTAAVATGCGDDAGTATSPSKATQAFVTLTEAESLIEDRALAIVRSGEADGYDRPLVDAARYESQSGREFDLLVFASQSAARRAAPAVVDLKDGESGVRAANLVAVFPERFARVDAYRAVARALRRLRIACDPRGGGDPRLRRICFGPGAAGVPPAGEGVDRDEAQDEEEPIVVGGLHYGSLLARRMNPRIAPDEAMLAGRLPPDGKVWFGVFLRVCNRSDQTHKSSDRMSLVSAFGARIRPFDGPAPADAFAYEKRTLDPGECVPAEGSVAERTDGALVLFAVGQDFLGDRPVALEVDAERVILDV
jgi:hypothetical protein